MNINSNFYKVIDKYASTPFEYGVNDCALMCDNIYKEAFGMDLAAGIRGTYSDKLGAAKVLIREGGWDGILLKQGFVKLNVKLAKRGDIVISEDGAAGILLGVKAVFAGGAFRSVDKLVCGYSYKE